MPALGTSTRSIPQTPARASSALGLWGSPGSIPVPGAGVSAGVQGRKQCPSRAGDKPLAALPMGARPAGQGWVPASPAAAVALPAPASGVLGRAASAHTSLVLPAAAGTGAASPTSPWPPRTPRGDSAWGQYSRPLTPKKGKPDLVLGTGTKGCPYQFGLSSYWEQSSGTLGSTGGGCA